MHAAFDRKRRAEAAADRAEDEAARLLSISQDKLDSAMLHLEETAAVRPARAAVSALSNVQKRAEATEAALAAEAARARQASNSSISRRRSPSTFLSCMPLGTTSACAWSCYPSWSPSTPS